MDSEPARLMSDAPPRQILHVDLDAFYASVEIRDRPELKNRPVAVGGSPANRGVVAAASYAARRFGVYSAMPTHTALRLCPELIVLPPRHDYYAQISRQIRDLLEAYTPLVEPLSLDEAFLDITGSLQLWGNARQIGHLIRTGIRDTVRLVASVGIAPNKFLAKLASDLQKPNGFVVIEPAQVQSVLDPLPVARLWGVGRVGVARLGALGITTIGQLRQYPRDELRSRFGASGAHLWQLAHGHDEQPVIRDSEAKSLSHETTFAQDIDELETLRGIALELTEQVGRRLRRCGHKARAIEVKIRHSDFRTMTRSRRVATAIDTTTALWQIADTLLTDTLSEGAFSIRLIGMGVSELATDTAPQLDLFAAAAARETEFDAVSDRIKDRFGDQAVRRGLARPGKRR